MKAKLDWQTFTTNAVATFLGVELSVKYNGNGKFEATVYIKGRRPEKDHTFSTLKDGMEWCEQTLQRWINASFEPVSEPLMQRDRIIQAVNALTDICHSASRNAGWWHDIKTCEPLKRNKGEMLMLMVSELAEAMEADRKSLQDDHLPQYDGVSVEMADCLIRICDFVGGFGLKTAEAMADKIEYNANRADHKIENRLKDNGKKY